MNLSDEVDLEDYVARPDRISGADINSICQEVSFKQFLFSAHAQILSFHSLNNTYFLLFAFMSSFNIVFLPGWYAGCPRESVRGPSQGLREGVQERRQKGRPRI